MTFLKSLWLRLFGYPADSYYNLGFNPDALKKFGNAAVIVKPRPAYDPSLDEMKIMNGEVESYFE